MNNTARQTIRENKTSDPVEQIGDGCWIFWDETWSTSYGPYPTEQFCRQKLEEYSVAEDFS